MNLLSEQSINCPYCGEIIEILVDCSERDQSYIEDCQVCCRPINILVNINEKNNVLLNVLHENE